MNSREITYDNFLSYVSSKFKSERARTALVKNKASQVIRELAPNNPVYYEKLRERLEKIIQEEKDRRKKDADYFNDYKKILQEALDEDKERKKLGFSTMFEFAVYEELRSVIKDDKVSKRTTKAIFDQIKKETEIVEWKTKTGSKKRMGITIYDILTENKFPDSKVNELTQKVIDLAERNL
jgi:type I restriction enzyme R subunit